MAPVHLSWQQCTLISVVVLAGCLMGSYQSATDKHFIAYFTNPAISSIQFYWKDNKGSRLGSIARLKTFVEQQHATLLFAMNGGMYTPGKAPQGLFIQDKKMVIPADTGKGNGNFYLQPNGIFYITERHKAAICKTGDFINDGNVEFATQSGPMLLIHGSIHPAFAKGSVNLEIRNGVGILPGNRIVFAISVVPVNFYAFADYFKTLGCSDALYLDGFVSRMYLPAKSLGAIGW